MHVAKYILEKGVSVTLNSEGELTHHAHVLFYVPPWSDVSACCPEERYRRLAIETSVRPLITYISIKTDSKYARCKRAYIEYGDRLLDVLIPQIEQRMFENSYRAVLDGYIAHIPLLTLPNDEILMSFYAKRPFTVVVRVEW
jgi:hypothetical protein